MLQNMKRDEQRDPGEIVSVDKFLHRAIREASKKKFRILYILG